MSMSNSPGRNIILTARKFGPFYNCWSVRWVIWLLGQTAIILLSAFISDGGLAKAASRMVTCGVESGPKPSARPIFWQVRIQKHLYSTTIQAVPA